MRAIPTLSLILVLLGTAASSRADDYPTKPDDKDELCQSIGKSTDPSTPVKDRLWFMESCMCLDNVGCGSPGSPRFASRVEAERARLESRQQAEADQRAADEKAQAARRVEALKEIRQACVPLADCHARNEGDPRACEALDTTFEYDCSAALRDAAACGQAVQAAARTRAAADCQSALR
jgi:hypothetical protein